ncbi:MAG: OmpH family outer membrane protein [Deltaproteobacteria bacterium]|nr:OmpH family outer membrane protein [Deltaproteobacteria bacterium]
MTRRSALIFLSTTLLLVFAFGTSFAQNPLTIAYVDLQQFQAKSKRIQEMQKRFSELNNIKRTGLEKKQNELKSLSDQLQKQGPMLKEETRNEKIKELGMKEMELKLAQKQAESELQNEARALDESMMRDLIKIIGALRKQKNLSLILNSTSAILSADDSLDITEEVAKLYDSSAGSKPAAEKGKPATPPAVQHPKPKPK